MRRAGIWGLCKDGERVTLVLMFKDKWDLDSGLRAGLRGAGWISSALALLWGGRATPHSQDGAGSRAQGLRGSGWAPGAEWAH